MNLVGDQQQASADGQRVGAQPRVTEPDLVDQTGSARIGHLDHAEVDGPTFVGDVQVAAAPGDVDAHPLSTVAVASQIVLPEQTQVPGLSISHRSSSNLPPGQAWPRRHAPGPSHLVSGSNHPDAEVTGPSGTPPSRRAGPRHPTPIPAHRAPALGRGGTASVASHVLALPGQGAGGEGASAAQGLSGDDRSRALLYF